MSEFFPSLPIGNDRLFCYNTRMTILHSIILGLVEGFTEFLPISSTAHLILVSKLLSIDQSMFVKTFEIAIQGGAILAVIIFYWRKLLDLEILKRLIVSFIPTAIIGFILYKLIKDILVGNMTIVLLSLFLGGLVLIYIDRVSRIKNNIESGRAIKELTYKEAFMIGIAQSLAIIPGVSRSAATIVGGLFLGMNMKAVVEYSFLLAIPTIVAATGYDLIKNIHSFSTDQTSMLIVGFVASFITAIFGIRLLNNVAKRSSMKAFGMYRISLVILVVILVLIC